MRLPGFITVTWKRQKGEHICTALEFDLIGLGATRDEAFRNLREIVQSYFEEAVKLKGPVRLFNPSPAAEWNVENKHYYSDAEFRSA